MEEENTKASESESQSTSPTPSSTAGNDNLIAAISYLWIISIVVLIVKKDSEYVTFHARQGCVLLGAAVVVSITTYLLPFLEIFAWLAQLAIFVAVVVGFIQAISGKRYKMPLVGDLAEKVKF